MEKRRTFRTKLLMGFTLAALIPLSIYSTFSFINTSNIINESMQDLAAAGLRQTQSNMDIVLGSFEDILFQIYTDDETIELVKKLDHDEMPAIARNQLKRKLSSMTNAKEYIKSITIITDNGTVIFRDSLVPYSQENSWLSMNELGQEKMYTIVSSDNGFHFFPTQKAADFAMSQNYLFHIAHRMIDYKDINKRIGIVILSIDEELLHSLCNVSESDNYSDYNNFCFFLADDGTIITYPDRSYLGQKISIPADTDQEPENIYGQFVYQSGFAKKKEAFFLTSHDEKNGYSIISVSSQSETMAKLRLHHRTNLFICLAVMILMGIMTILSTKDLTGSMQAIISVLKKARNGDMSVRVNNTVKMPLEFASIGVQFNQTMDQFEESIQKEKTAYEKQKDAEIVALEAQINPHFLYNTLDTINWMALDHDEYEISSALSSLAKILRYSIDNSNGIVTIREEIEWLKQYLLLQIIWMKDPMSYNIHVDESILDFPIHKLLLQPFVENTILHGFEGITCTPRLNISIRKQDEMLIIDISDNGIGMSSAIVEQINKGVFPHSSEKNHIGLENAMNRIRLYYGEQTMISVLSREMEGTEVIITIPLGQELRA